MAPSRAQAARASAHQPIVIVTGVSGSIGGAAARTLAADYHVVGLDREGIDPNAEDCFEFDLTSDESIAGVFAGIRDRYGNRIASVVHLAAYFDWTGEDSPLYEQVNVEGTRRLLRALQPFDVEQFVYSSSMLVHAPTEPGVPITEDSPLDAKWAYPRSKLHTEAVIREERGDIPCTVLRIAGLYTEQGGAPTLAHQVQRIFERRLQSHLFAGEIARGQSFVHMDDVVDAIVRSVDRRANLTDSPAILIGEPATMTYEALQNELGRLIHGESWRTLSMPKPVAQAGAWVQEKMEPVVPDSIDRGEKPFIRAFMVAMSDDHYELDVSRARERLGWQPRHSLRDDLPDMIELLKADPAAWYRANRLIAPEWMRQAEADERLSGDLGSEHERRYRTQHRDSLWAHFVTMGLGAWLMSSPPILGYTDRAMIWSDVASGAVILVLAALSLSWRLGWARWVNGAVGLWLLSAPLVLWSPSAAAYLNGTLVGALVIGFALLVRPLPGIAPAAAAAGPDIPDGWDFSPSTWTQRLPIIMLAFVGLFVSRYLAAFQLGHIPAAWDPFFGDGTERVITSSMSQAWPVSDAGLGALTYMLEILTGLIGSRARWRTMPWLVVLFGIMIVPLGVVSIFFIIIQPIVIGTWCALCLLAAAAMLLQIPYSFDELVATGQFLWQRKKAGRSLLRIFFMGDAADGGRRTGRADFERSPAAVIRDMWTGGVGLPWTLAASTLIGIGLMCTRLIFGTAAPLAHSDHLLGALVVTVSVTAFAEVARSVRFANVLLGMALMGSPFMLDGGTLISEASVSAAGLLLIGLNLRRGPVRNGYGSWDRYIV